MIRILTFVLALIAAGPATALSCLAPSVQTSYRAADDSAQNYVIAVGSLRAVRPSNPPQGAVALGGDINNMQGFTQPALFEGQFFTGTPFPPQRTDPVLVEVGCLSAWCGGFSDIGRALMFIRSNPDGTYALEIGPCPQFVFADPTDDMLRTVEACFNGRC